MKSFYLFLCLLALPLLIISQESYLVSGKITNELDQSVPFTSVYVEALKKSSMANELGEYQISLPRGTHELVFQSLSHETKRVDVNVNGEKELDIQLKSISYALKAVEVDPDSEDPAYNIIRKSIAMAQYYKRQKEAFDARLYARTSFKLNEIPWWMEAMVDDEGEEDVEAAKAGQILESIVEYSYQRGGKIREKIIAQKSGTPLDSGFQGSTYINLDFYNLGGPGMISPLSRSAFAVYKFEYQASIYEGSQLIHRIKIIPKRRGSDLMKGEIFINDLLWNVNKVNVEFQSPTSMIHYKQIYQEVDTNVWFPMNHQISGEITVVGIEAEFRYLATIKEVNVTTDPQIDEEIMEKLILQQEDYLKKVTDSISEDEKEVEKPKADLSRSEKREQKINDLMEKEELTKGESFKLVRLIKKQQAEEQAKRDTAKSLEVKNNYKIEYADSAWAKNDSLWNEERQIPLTKEDQEIYKKSDSLFKVQSGDTVINKEQSTLSKILFFNERVKTKNKAVDFRPKGVFSGLGGYFNTVDGYTLSKSLFTFEKNKRKGSYYRIEPKVAYAFSRHRWLGEMNFSNQYHKKSGAGFDINLGTVSEDFNGNRSMSDQSNSVSSLFFLENFPSFYQRNFVEIAHHLDVFPNLELVLNFQYNDREQLFNTSSQDLALVDGEYSSNTPENINVTTDPEIISSHQSGIIEGRLSYHPGQRYRYFRGKKIKLNTQKPKYFVNYRMGVPDLFDSDAQFSQISAGMEQKTPFRLIDRIAYRIEMGKFLNTNQLYFADYQSFFVKPSEFSLTTNPFAFALLPYHAFNSNDYFFSANLNVRNNFILLKYLPLLNRTEWKEEIGASFLYTELERPYYEFSYGFSKILMMMDVKAYVSFLDHEYSDFGIRVSFSLND